MKAKRLVCAVLAAVLCLGMSGCGGMLESGYYSESLHVQQYEPVEGSDALRAENYAGLQDAVLSFVWNMESAGTVQLNNYVGSVSDDLASVRSYVMREDAIGAYCVEDIVFYANRIVSYYEITFQIQYRRTAEEMAEIISVANSTEAYEALSAAMSAHEPQLTMKLSYFEGWEDGIDDYCEAIYYDNPSSAFLMPTVSYDVYPEESNQRIIEVDFKNVLDEESFRRYQALVEEEAQRVVDRAATYGMEGDAIRQRAVLYTFYEYLAYNVKFDETAVLLSVSGNAWVMTLSYTAFGAFINKLATGEGVALAMKLLCDRVGIDCMVVRGRRDSYDHAWNIVCVEGVYYHLDGTSADGFLLSDREMPSNYVWNREAYPSCKDE